MTFRFAYKISIIVINNYIINSCKSILRDRMRKHRYNIKSLVLWLTDIRLQFRYSFLLFARSIASCPSLYSAKLSEAEQSAGKGHGRLSKKFPRRVQ